MKSTDDTARVTTAPAADSDLRRGLSRNLRIRWLYPDSGRISGAVVERLVLGRADDCQVILKGTEASRHHAELIRDGPLVLLRDLGSRNGTFSNGERISEAPLASGDIVRLGEWVGLAIESDGDSTLGGFQRFADKLWGGPELAAALEPARRAAESELSMILEGETGTGKERVARAIHVWSGRKGPFLAVNCAALPEALAEGELFGYRRGAFTGADRANPGHFQSARGGSLLLDEIGDLPPSLQAKLLRVLEEREVLPLGESRAVSVDVRIIAAGQASLRQAVEKKQFRGDLFARLDGLTVRLPPLRSRVADIPALFEQFVKEFVSGPAPQLEPRLVERLCIHDWPFNVRELELLARRLVTLYAREGTLKRTHLPPEVGEARVRPKLPSQDDAAPPSDRAKEMELLLDALRRHQGNVARAAASVGISRQRAYRLMEGRSDVDLKTLRRARHRA